MAVTPVQRAGGIFPPGGGGTTGRIIRPNLTQINRLRGQLLTEPRPGQIRRVAVFDDDVDIAELFAGMLKFHLGKISGRGVELINLSSLQGKRLASGTLAVVWDNSIEGISAAPAFVIENGVDFVFTDFNMPGLNGDALVRQVRAGMMPTQPLIVGLTAREDNLGDFYAAGADVAAMKPLNIDVAKGFFQANQA